jgi:DegV family protein with EDD domain
MSTVNHLDFSRPDPTARLDDQPLPKTMVGLGDRDKSKARITIVVDAACDLPPEWLNAREVLVMPIVLEVGEWQLVDERDPYDTIEFFRKHIAEKGAEAQSRPMTVQETRDYLIENLAANHDHVIALAISGKRSKIYMNTLSAAQQLMLMHGRARKHAQIETPFKMWVVDSESLFAGQGVLAAHAISMLRAGVNASDMVNHLSALRDNLHAFVVPKDVYYLRTRAHTKGDRSVNWFVYNLGKLLDVKPIVYANKGESKLFAKVRGYEEACYKVIDIAGRALQNGLLTPFIVASYAGDIADIEAMPTFQLLRLNARQRGVEVLLSTMSMTGGLNVGSDAFSIAFAAKNPNLS